MARPKKSNLPAGIRKSRTATPPYFVYEINFLATGSLGQRFERVGTDLREAKRRLVERKREVAEGTYEPGRRAKEKITVAELAVTWLDEREGEVITVGDDRKRFELHILPELGACRVSEVDSARIADLLSTLRHKQGARYKKPLSKNTILNIYANLVTFFNDAEQQGYTLRNPCAGLRKAQRPKKPPRSETQGIAFSADVVSGLISDHRIPADRQMLYALQFLTGTRIGEAVGFRWLDYDRAKKPLGHLRLERQYEDLPLKGKRSQPGPPRDIPVHPTLAAMLAEWKLQGFAKMFARHPEPNDFIVPAADGGCRRLRTTANHIARDCGRIGVEHKPATHVARRTFVTLASAGGASESWLRRITHNANGDVLTGYQVNHWQAMCETVTCLKIVRLLSGQVVQLERAEG